MPRIPNEARAPQGLRASSQMEPSSATRLSPWFKMLYGLGQVAQSGGFEAAAAFVFFYYTAVLGLSGASVGLALGISLCFDALIDPVVGSLSDNIRSRLGRRLPLMIIAVPLIVVSLGLLFSPPRVLPPPLLVAWLAAASISVRASVSLFNVPYIALGAELADGYVERSSIVAYRTMVGIFTNMAVIAVAYTVFFGGVGGLTRRDGYPGFGWSVALVLLVGMTLSCLGMAAHAARLPRSAPASGALFRRLPGEMREIFANRSFRTLFASAVIFYVAIGANATLGSHVAIFVWRLAPKTIQFIGYATLVGVFIGVPITPLLQRRLEKRAVVMIGIGLMISSWVILPSLRAAGAISFTGSAALGPLIANALVLGVGVGFAVIAYPSMMADAADEHEHLFGRQRAGLYFAGLGFAAKAASGLGVLVAGSALDILGFPADAARHAGAVLAEPLLRRLVLGWGPLPAVLGVTSLAMLTRYGITRERHDVISAELRLKHAGQAISASPA